MRKLFLIVAIFLTFSVYGQDAQLKIGDNAPDISLPTPRGDTLSLSSMRGRLVLVDFWATWCAPCVEEQPELRRLYDRLEADIKGGRFQILGVSLDRSKENWEKGIGRLGVIWPQVSDLKFWRSVVAKDYHIESLPFNVLVNGEGKIMALNLHGADLEKSIVQYLQ